MYRVSIWLAATGAIKKKLNYKKFDLAKARAIEHSRTAGVREVSVCPIDSDGTLGQRLGVAAHGEWADGKFAPRVPMHLRTSNPAVQSVKRTRKRR